MNIVALAFSVRRVATGVLTAVGDGRNPVPIIADGDRRRRADAVAPGRAAVGARGRAPARTLHRTSRPRPVLDDSVRRHA